MNNRQEYPTAGGDGLQTAVRRSEGILLTTEKVPVLSMIPTPTARDHKDGANVSCVPENGLLGRWAPNHSSIPGKLNPDWVSRMMGFPDGWMDDLPDLGTPIGKQACPASVTDALIGSTN